jgi:pyruvate,water dikinase
MSREYVRRFFSFLSSFSKAGKPKEERTPGPFRKVFLAFRELLAANSEALRLMADMEEKAAGDFLFDMRYVETTAAELDTQVQRLVAALEVVAGHKFPGLEAVRARLRQEIEGEVSTRTPIPAGELVLPLVRVGREMRLEAGGKGANLGEMAKLGLPVPPGFVVTSAAYKDFLAGGLGDRIRQRLQEADTSSFEGLTTVSHEVQAMVREAEVPEPIAQAIERGYRDLARGKGVRVAMRSSAVHEDSALTFAGQYATLLDVGADEVISAWREVVSSQFTARALFYFKAKGLIEDEAAMAVACMEMVEARAAGVAFSINPDTGDTTQAVIDAAWGLGKYVVDGRVSADHFIVDKETGQVLRERIADKPVMLVAAEGGGTREVLVEEELRLVPALSEADLAALARYLRALESHYEGPQDIEFAVDKAGKIHLLQTRPLRPPSARRVAELARPFLEHRLLCEGVVASMGVAAGQVHRLERIPTEGDLAAIPKGAVVVIAHTSPSLSPALPKISAIVSDVGSATGHLSLLAREYGVPTVVDTHSGTEVLSQGMLVTVDATSGKVYEGRVDVLLEAAARQAPLPEDTPVRKRLQAVMQRSVPLHLVDPKSPHFKPKYCETYHDITRFVHETAINEMFGLVNRGNVDKTNVARVKTTLPFNLHIVDLGGGIDDAGGPVTPERFLSIPMKALWRGIANPNVTWSGPVPVDFGGLLHILGQTAVRPPEDFWDKTYAIVSGDYVNYSSRLGYHFSTVDSLCGPNLNDNYITFMFKGGAADEVRRGRRAQFLSEVLERLGFDVRMTGDLVNAQFRKYDREMTEEKLDQLGRLMGAARQLDMRMSDDSIIDFFVEAFLAGNYAFDPPE